MPAPDNGEAAVERAVAAFPDWSGRPVDTRAGCLDLLADLYEAHRTELMAVAVQEAQKTIPDALAEVREAVDFCRYYAARARTDLNPLELPGPTGERNVLRMNRSEEHTSELQSLMRISYAVFGLKKKQDYTHTTTTRQQ